MNDRHLKLKDAIEVVRETVADEYIESTLELRLLDKSLTADVVEVVRCKDCRWGKEVCGNIECFADTNVPPEYHSYEWFCPNGERRTDAQTS